jgi:DNA-binding MarR family transcriptional regulator
MLEAENEVPVPLLGRSEVASYLGYLLRRIRGVAGEASARQQAALGACCGGSDRSQLKELAVLVLLGQLGACSQHEVAGRLGINRSVMVKVIDELEREGAVVRSRDPGDRRRYALEVTAAGWRRAAVLLAWAGAVETALLAPLDEAERARLLGLLSALDAAHRPPVPAPLSGSLMWHLISLHHELERFGDQVLEVFGLSVRSFVVLAILEDEPCSQARLGEWMSIGPAATVELVDQLEAGGLLARARSVDDRRRYRLELTEEGRALHARARPVVEAASDRFTAALGPTGREALLDLLARVAGGGLPGAAADSRAEA